jgi:hypothetical protein
LDSFSNRFVEEENRKEIQVMTYEKFFILRDGRRDKRNAIKLLIRIKIEDIMRRLKIKK